MALVTQAEHARLCGVSRKSVTIWKSQGRLVLVDGLVDHDASYRGDSWHASVKAARGDVPTPAAPSNKPASAVPIRLRDDAPEERAGPVDLKDAILRKEDYTGRLRELDFQERAGNLIDVEIVKREKFDDARHVRDTLLNWVPRNAALIAADLGVEADKTAEILTGYVHRLIINLGDPRRDGAQG